RRRGADQSGGLLDETGDVHVPGAGSVHDEASVREQTRLFELVAERESAKLVTMCDQLVERRSPVAGDRGHANDGIGRARSRTPGIPDAAPEPPRRPIGSALP